MTHQKAPKITLERPFHLYTIRFSHYCDKARWILELYQLPYQEHVYPPIIHMKPVLTVTRNEGKQEKDSSPGSTPALIIPHQQAKTLWYHPMIPYDQYSVICDSSDITRYLSQHYSTPGKNDLYFQPDIINMEKWLSDELGPHARRVAYFDILPNLNMTKDIMYQNFPLHIYLAYKLISSRFTKMMNAALGITPDRTARSRQKVRAIFQQISTLLSDGRTYLVGDRFSAADLTFASLGGVMVGINHSHGYGAYLPSLESMPDSEYKRLSLELRQTPAGQFIHRIYRDHRPKNAQLIVTKPALPLIKAKL